MSFPPVNSGHPALPPSYVRSQSVNPPHASVAQQCFLQQLELHTSGRPARQSINGRVSAASQEREIPGLRNRRDVPRPATQVAQGVPVRAQVGSRGSRPV